MFTKISLFGQTKSLEKKIDLMHDRIIDINMTFKKSIKIYLEDKSSEEYKKLNKEIYQIETDNDALRREIENELYSRNLIPDLRENVLVLIESLDKVVNAFYRISGNFYVEQPHIDEKYHTRVKDLCSQVADCVENMIIASRAYFKNFNIVRDYARKVYFIETEADKIARNIRKEIFASDMPLAEKMHVSSFVSDISDVANIAEDCVDLLMIYALKRVI